MKSLLKLTHMQFKLFAREPVALFFTLAFPLLLLVLFGVIFGNQPDPVYGGRFGYIDAQVPGLAAIVIGTVGMMSIPVATATAREQKVLRRYKASPMRPWTYLTADVLVQTVAAFIGLVLLILTGLLLFDLRFGGQWAAVGLGFTLSTLSFAAVGYVIAGMAPTPRVAQVLGQVVFFPMMFLSGATLPLEIMPESVRTVGNFLPLTHVVKLLQNLWFGQGWAMESVWVLVGLLVAGTLISTAVFRWE